MQERFNKNFNEILQKTGADFSSVAVAVSGGADSMAMAILLNNWARQTGKKFYAITVDHNLRQDSHKESLQVQNILKKQGVNTVIIKNDIKLDVANLEANARDVRYKILFGFCKKNKVNLLAVGHQKDEQVETFLLNLIRGSGVYGLSGIKDIYKTEKDIFVTRPMLQFSKEEIKTYLTKNGVQWVEDPMNKDDKFKRAKIRKMKGVFADLDLTENRILKTVENMNRTRQAIEFYTNQAEQKIVKKADGKSHYFFKTDLYKNLPEEIQLRLLSDTLQKIGSAKYPPRMENLQRLKDEILQDLSKTAFTLGGVKIEKYKQGQLKLSKLK